MHNNKTFFLKKSNKIYIETQLNKEQVHIYINRLQIIYSKYYNSYIQTSMKRRPFQKNSFTFKYIVNEKFDPLAVYIDEKSKQLCIPTSLNQDGYRKLTYAEGKQYEAWQYQQCKDIQNKNIKNAEKQQNLSDGELYKKDFHHRGQKTSENIKNYQKNITLPLQRQGQFKKIIYNVEEGQPSKTKQRYEQKNIIAKKEQIGKGKRQLLRSKSASMQILINDDVEESELTKKIKNYEKQSRISPKIYTNNQMKDIHKDKDIFQQIHRLSIDSKQDKKEQKIDYIYSNMTKLIQFIKRNQHIERNDHQQKQYQNNFGTRTNSQKQKQEIKYLQQLLIKSQQQKDYWKQQYQSVLKRRQLQQKIRQKLQIQNQTLQKQIQDTRQQLTVQINKRQDAESKILQFRRSLDIWYNTYPFSDHK